MNIRRLFFFSSIVLLALGVCFGGALYYERNQIEKATANYISIWEDEIVQSLIAQQDKKLLEKVVSQLQLVSLPIENTKFSLLSDSFQIRDSYSLLQLQIPLSVNYMTVGLVDVMLSQRRMIAATLFSPIFLVSVFLVLGAALLIWVRGQRAAYEQNALRQKVQQQTEITQLARQVAHDIRGPLSALQVIASKEDALAPAYRDLFKQGAGRIHKVAEELLSSSRNSKPFAFTDAVPAPSEVSLDNIMKTLHAEFSIRSPNIKWVFDDSSKGGINLNLSESHLMRILANLLQNSSEADAKRVNISVVKKKNEMIFLVQDDGRGISQEILPNIFKDEVSYGKANGNGIGLKTAKESVEKVGGQFLLTSKVNQGTLVQMRIPLDS